jgi:hypothetical protein
MLWIFTGTREFFDSKKGVGGLEPLHDRIKFTSSGGFVSPKQPQLELKPFDKQRLKAVALKLREIFPTNNKSKIHNLVDDDFLDSLCNLVTEGLKGDVGVIPRQFLRELITVLDLVEEHDGSDGGKAYIPKEVYDFPTGELSEEDQSLVDGNTLSRADGNSNSGYDVEALEW